MALLAPPASPFSYSWQLREFHAQTQQFWHFHKGPSLHTLRETCACTNMPQDSPETRNCVVPQCRCRTWEGGENFSPRLCSPKKKKIKKEGGRKQDKTKVNLGFNSALKCMQAQKKIGNLPSRSHHMIPQVRLLGQ